MKNKTLTEVAIGILIIGTILLSGCVDNVQNTKTTPTKNTTQTPIVVKTLSSETSPEQTPSNFTVTKINASISSSARTESANTTNSTKSTALTSSDSDWCVPGNKKSVAGTEFTITGLTTDNKGVSLCSAESEIPNGKATYVFSKDGKISKMTSSASSSNGSASSSASAFANSNTS